MKRTVKIFSIVLLAVLIGGASGVLANRIVFPWLSSKECFSKLAFFEKANENVTVINKTEQVIVKEDFSVAKTAQNVIPSVVKIVSYEENDKQKASYQGIKSSKEIEDSVKTGLIVTNDGVIVSVKREREDVEKVGNLKYKILMSDDRAFDAELFFVDEYSELEFYKTKEENLPTPTFGSSRDLESGEKVIVIGNTGGEYQNSFSLGVINEIDGTYTLLNSQLSSSEKIEGAILSDANINNKNIGGPVLDFNGTVIGLANINFKDGENEGFILPIDKIKDTIDSIVKGREIQRGKLGVYYLSIDKEIALLSSLPVSSGALVYSFSGQQGLAVKRGSAADLAGIKIGDVILSVNDSGVTLEKPLANLLSAFKIGDSVTLEILRGNEKIKKEVTLQ